MSEAQKWKVTRLIEAGVAHSAELLGLMSKTQWGIMTSSVNEIPVVRLISWFHREKSRCIGAILRARAEVPLEFLILFNESSARAVAESVVKPVEDKIRSFPDWVSMSVGEISNVLAQGVIGALADAMDTMIILSAPEVKEGTRSQILSEALEAYDGRQDMLVTSQVNMYSENLSAECNMIIIINADCLRRMLS